MELFCRMRDVVFRVEDNVWMVSLLEGEVVDPVFAFRIELSVNGLFFGLVFGKSFLVWFVLHQ